MHCSVAPLAVLRCCVWGDAVSMAFSLIILVPSTGECNVTLQSLLFRAGSCCSCTKRMCRPWGGVHLSTLSQCYDAPGKVPAVDVNVHFRLCVYILQAQIFAYNTHMMSYSYIFKHLMCVSSSVHVGISSSFLPSKKHLGVVVWVGQWLGGEVCWTLLGHPSMHNRVVWS